MNLTFSATIEYEIWRQDAEQGSQTAAGTYKKAALESDGGLKFALRSEGVKVRVSLPAGLGGAAVDLVKAEGFAKVQPGPVIGRTQTFQITEVRLSAPSVKLPDGRETGGNVVTLAPGYPASGRLDLDTGKIDIQLTEMTVNDLFPHTSPIILHSRLVGLYDPVIEEAHVITLAVDEFPKQPRHEKRSEQKK